MIKTNITFWQRINDRELIILILHHHWWWLLYEYNYAFDCKRGLDVEWNKIIQLKDEHNTYILGNKAHIFTRKMHIVYAFFR